MANNDSLQKTVQNLVQTCELAVKCYENYLLDKSDWKDLAKVMKRVRSLVSDYHTECGK